MINVYAQHRLLLPFYLGTEEQYTELEMLIQDLSERQSDMDLAETTKKTETKRKADGVRVRKVAMLQLKDKSKKTEGNSFDDLDDDQSVDSFDSSTSTPVAKRHRTSAAQSQTELLEFMRERDKRNAELRKEELAIERLKAENQAKQLDLLFKKMEGKEDK